MVIPKIPSPKDERKRLMRECDALWRVVIRARDKVCQHCSRGEGYQLDTHHIITRSIKCLRWDPLNGILLCAYCHCLGNDSAHKNPVLFVEWYGRDKYDILLQKRRNRLKTDASSLRLLKMYLQEEVKKWTK